MDSTLRVYHRACNYITNMKHACLFLFENFETFANFGSVYVRGGYQKRGTIGFVINNLKLEDCFKTIEWFQTQFKSKYHSFYRYTIDVEEQYERLSIFIDLPAILRKVLFEKREDQVSLAIFLNTLNNLNFEYLQMKIEEDVQQQRGRYNASEDNKRTPAEKSSE